MIAFRLAVTDKTQRILRRSFSLYLAPAVIEKMLSSGKLPSLGGEIRRVTMYFSDIASFSALAENTPPAELVALMNVYLSAMTDIIEAHGGFVDKYVGDAIVAVFGAPVADDDHAVMACGRRLPAAGGWRSSTAARLHCRIASSPTGSGSIPGRRWSAISGRAGASTIPSSAMS
jgi:class 3 adenylate cyclase